MGKIGIDLSLRSTGLCWNDGHGNVEFKLINNKQDDEELLYKNTEAILDFLKGKTVTEINIEGLSFGSLSGSKDILAGNFWHLRVKLWEKYSHIPINIIPVLTWRSPLFNKEERKAMKEAEKQSKAMKKTLKGLKGNERKKKIEELGGSPDLACDIKYQTFLKLPKDIQEKIIKITDKNGKYDLTDSYFICNHSNT